MQYNFPIKIDEFAKRGHRVKLSALIGDKTIFLRFFNENVFYFFLFLLKLFHEK